MQKIPTLNLSAVSCGGGWGLGEKYSHLPPVAAQLQQPAKMIYNVVGDVKAHHSDDEDEDDAHPSSTVQAHTTTTAAAAVPPPIVETYYSGTVEEDDDDTFVDHGSNTDVPPSKPRDTTVKSPVPQPHGGGANAAAPLPPPPGPISLVIPSTTAAEQQQQSAPPLASVPSSQHVDPTQRGDSCWNVASEADEDSGWAEAQMVARMRVTNPIYAVAVASSKSIWAAIGDDPLTQFELQGCTVAQNSSFANVSAVRSLCVVQVPPRSAAVSFGKTASPIPGRQQSFSRQNSGSTSNHPSNSHPINNSGRTTSTTTNNTTTTTTTSSSEESLLWCGLERGHIAILDLFFFHEEGIISQAHGGSAVTGIWSVGNTGRVWTTGEDRTLKVWDASTRKLIVTKKITEPVAEVCYVPATNQVWVTCREPLIRVYDVDGRESLRGPSPVKGGSVASSSLNQSALRLKGRVYCLKFHAPSGTVWVCSEHEILLYHPKSLECVATLSNVRCRTLDFTPEFAFAVAHGTAVNPQDERSEHIVAIRLSADLKKDFRVSVVGSVVEGLGRVGLRCIPNTGYGLVVHGTDVNRSITVFTVRPMEAEGEWGVGEAALREYRPQQEPTSAVLSTPLLSQHNNNGALPGTTTAASGNSGRRPSFRAHHPPPSSVPVPPPHDDASTATNTMVDHASNETRDDVTLSPRDGTVCYSPSSSSIHPSVVRASSSAMMEAQQQQHHLLHHPSSFHRPTNSISLTGSLRPPRATGTVGGGGGSLDPSSNEMLQFLLNEFRDTANSTRLLRVHQPMQQDFNTLFAKLSAIAVTLPPPVDPEDDLEGGGGAASEAIDNSISGQKRTTPTSTAAPTVPLETQEGTFMMRTIDRLCAMRAASSQTPATPPSSVLQQSASGDHPHHSLAQTESHKQQQQQQPSGADLQPFARGFSQLVTTITSERQRNERIAASMMQQTQVQRRTLEALVAGMARLEGALDALGGSSNAASLRTAASTLHTNSTPAEVNSVVTALVDRLRGLPTLLQPPVVATAAELPRNATPCPGTPTTNSESVDHPHPSTTAPAAATATTTAAAAPPESAAVQKDSYFDGAQQNNTVATTMSSRIAPTKLEGIAAVMRSPEEFLAVLNRLSTRVTEYTATALNTTTRLSDGRNQYQITRALRGASSSDIVSLVEPDPQLKALCGLYEAETMVDVCRCESVMTIVDTLAGKVLELAQQQDLANGDRQLIEANVGRLTLLGSDLDSAGAQVRSWYVGLLAIAEEEDRIERRERPQAVPSATRIRGLIHWERRWIAQVVDCVDEMQTALCPVEGVETTLCIRRDNCEYFLMQLTEWSEKLVAMQQLHTAIDFAFRDAMSGHSEADPFLTVGGEADVHLVFSKHATMEPDSKFPIMGNLYAQNFGAILTLYLRLAQRIMEHTVTNPAGMVLIPNLFVDEVAIRTTNRPSAANGGGGGAAGLGSGNHHNGGDAASGSGAAAGSSGGGGGSGALTKDAANALPSQQREGGLIVPSTHTYPMNEIMGLMLEELKLLETHIHLLLQAFQAIKKSLNSATPKHMSGGGEGDHVGGSDEAATGGGGEAKVLPDHTIMEIREPLKDRPLRRFFVAACWKMEKYKLL